MASVSIEIDLPKNINFIRIRSVTYDDKAMTVAVGQLTQEEASRFADALRESFMQHWEEKKNERT